MKRIKTILICVVAVVLIIHMHNVNAYETPKIAGIEATLRPDITIKLDREIQALRDGNGVEVYPIMYNNTTYIPVRSVGTFLDKVVSWDGSKNAISIEGNLSNTEDKKEYIEETYATKSRSSIKATLRSDITIKIDKEIQTLKDGKGVSVYPIMYNNTTYIPIRFIGTFLDKDVNWDNSDESVYIGAYLNDIQVAENKVNFITLYDNCVHPLTGGAETLDSIDGYGTMRNAACFDSVKLDFPLFIDSDRNGNKNIIYDIYFQEDKNYQSLQENYDQNVKKYNLVIKKNQCSLFYNTKYTGLDTNINWCDFIYKSNNYPGKYDLDASRSIQLFDMTDTMVKNDIAEYAISIRNIYNFKDLKKVVFNVADRYGYRVFFSVDVSQIRTVSK